MKRLFLLLLCNFSFVANCLSQSIEINVRNSTQTYSLQSIDESYGFMQNTITGITQDDYGYMWYATANGAYRYDGYNFDVFDSHKGNTNYIHNNQIRNIAYCDPGKVIILNTQKINIYDTKEQKINIISIPDEYLSGPLSSLAPDPTGNRIWTFTHSNTLLAIEFNDSYDTIENISNYPLPSIENTVSIRVDKDRHIWVLYKNHLDVYEEDGDKLNTIFSLKTDGATQLIEDTHNDRMIVSHSGGLMAINRSNFATKSISLTHNGRAVSLSNITYSPDNKIIGIDWPTGVYNIDINTNTCVCIKTKLEDDNNGTHTLAYIYVDRSDVMWIGTVRGGLFKANISQKNFQSLQNRLSGSGNEAFINQITSNRANNVWVATFYDGIKGIKIEKDTVLISDCNKALNIDANDSQFALCYNDGYLWYINSQNYITRAQIHHDGSIGKVEPIRKVNAKKFAFFYLSNSQELYLAIGSNSNDGILRCSNPSDNEPQFVTLRYNNGDIAFKDIGISSLMKDIYGKLWIGTNDSGLFKADEQHNILSKQESIKISDNSDDSIYSIFEYNSLYVYVSVFNRGLVKVPLKDSNDVSLYEYYTIDNGLPSNAIYSIEYDGYQGDQGRLWISTDNGLCSFDPTNNSFNSYGVPDGVQNINFRKWSSHKLSDNTIIFGGSKGINYFSPDEINKNSTIPKPIITSCEVMGSPIICSGFVYTKSEAAQEVDNTNKITLKPNENMFSLGFTTIHFDNPHKNSSQYKLVGYDTQWHQVDGNTHKVTYSNMKAGEYEFCVKGYSRDNISSMSYSCISIVILPHFYQQVWFQLLILIILAAISYRIFLYFRGKQLQHINTKINKAQAEFFTNISHEIKTPLTIISGLLHKSQTENNSTLSGVDFQAVMRNSNRMLNLVGELLDFRKLNNNYTSFNPSSQNIVPFIDDITQAYQQAALASQIELSFNSETKGVTMFFEASIIDKILSNIISNALKFTPNGGCIKINIAKGFPLDAPREILKRLNPQHIDYITISVKDNGQGIPKDELKKIFTRFYQSKNNGASHNKGGVGIGLSYVKTLVEIQEGEIYADSVVNQGSTFNIILPTKLIKHKFEQDLHGPAASQEEYTIEETIAQEPVNIDNTEFAVDSEEELKELLVVEDNEDLRAFVRDIFKEQYRVIEATDGLDGYKKAIKRVPDIIISDVMMPHMDGVTLCGKLKEEEKTNHIPIILLTAKSAIDNRIDGLSAGADSYIAKPFNIEHLKIRVEKLLEMRNLLKCKYMKESPHKATKSINITDKDKQFIEIIESHIESNLSDPDFAIEELERLIGYSKMQLYRKVKTITGLSVVEFIRNYRLKRAAEMMHRSDSQIKEILYAVGFTTPSYFSKCFKRHYGVLPAEYIEQNNEVE